MGKPECVWRRWRLPHGPRRAELSYQHTSEELDLITLHIHKITALQDPMGPTVLLREDRMKKKTDCGGLFSAGTQV